MNKSLTTALKILGVMILVTLAILYRAGDEGNIHGFATYWWGILGLIGWAYLICGIGYVISGKQLTAAVLLWIVFSLFCVSAHAHWLPEKGIIRILISPFGDGSMPAFVMGGAIISLIYLRFRNENSFSKMFVVYVLITAALFILGFLTRPEWGVSKIRATPSWVWICSAITIVVFMLIFWVSDIKKKAEFFEFIKPAGTNTLLCYLLPYFAYAIVVASGIHYPDMMLTGIIGLIKSLLFALLVVWIAGKLGKVGLQLKL
jgi:hypothetical protein